VKLPELQELCQLTRVLLLAAEAMVPPLNLFSTEKLSSLLMAHLGVMMSQVLSSFNFWRRESEE
jgi:hypothetical protein